MTGFGRCEVSDGEGKFTVELKSVNHRYLDVNIRMPKKFNYFETSIRNLLKQYATRGKVDIFITYEAVSEGHMSLKYNQGLAKEYWAYFQKMSEDFGIDNDIRVSALSRYPEVLTMGEEVVDEKELWKGLEQACKGAFEQLLETRIAEGERLKADMLLKIEGMKEKIAYIESKSPEILAAYREKLETKIKELLSDTMIDESRIATELVLYSDKICTDEETVRLCSHMEHVKETLELDEGIGRKMDFIAQEMNREANTILSKANHLDISNCAIDLKTEIEKIREQIQNLE